MVRIHSLRPTLQFLTSDPAGKLFECESPQKGSGLWTAACAQINATRRLRRLRVSFAEFREPSPAQQDIRERPPLHLALARRTRPGLYLAEH